MTIPIRLLQPWLVAAALLAVAPLPGASTAVAQDLVQNSYYWYVPEHEKYSTTTFYAEPRFDTRQIRLTRTERFKLVDGTKGWFILEFDVAGKAYIHQRLLRSMLYDPVGADAWHEFKRASVFKEEPGKVQARLTATNPNAPAPQASDSKAPAWKRYKESWNLRPGRTSPSSSENPDGSASPSQSRPAEKKTRNRHPLLPPIGSEPQPDPHAAPETPGAQPGH